MIVIVNESKNDLEGGMQKGKLGFLNGWRETRHEVNSAFLRVKGVVEGGFDFAGRMIGDLREKVFTVLQDIVNP